MLVLVQLCDGQYQSMRSANLEGGGCIVVSVEHCQVACHAGTAMTLVQPVPALAVFRPGPSQTTQINSGCSDPGFAAYKQTQYLSLQRKSTCICHTGHI